MAEDLPDLGAFDITLPASGDGSGQVTYVPPSFFTRGAPDCPCLMSNGGVSLAFV